MPRNYTQKNPWFKNSRLDIAQTELMVLMYLKGVKASQCAETIGFSSGSISDHYKTLDDVILSEGFFLAFTRYLDKQNEDVLKNQLYIIRGILFNLNRKPEKNPDEEDWEIQWKEDFSNLAFLQGESNFYPSSEQLNSCIKWCKSETPPLVVRKMIDEGKLAEVREKRLACKNCPIRLNEIYSPPSDWRKNPCEESDNKKLVYEPNFSFKDSREIIMMLVDILWFLGHVRSLKKHGYFRKIMNGAYFSVLKRGEIKVSANLAGAGEPVLGSLLYPDQRESVNNGFRYVSTLDQPMVHCVLEALKESNKN